MAAALTLRLFMPDFNSPVENFIMEATIVYWGYIGTMENRMEAAIVYWGYIGIMENRMEAAIVYGVI